MSEKSEELKARTEEFAVATVKFCDKLPNSLAGRRVSQQLIDASTSVAANYRAVCRAYTSRLFVSKLAIVDEDQKARTLKRAKSISSGEARRNSP